MFDATINTEAETKEAAGKEAYIAALWVCGECQVWWGSQVGQHKEARYLLYMAEPNTNLFKWEDYRGWRVRAAEAAVCPECGCQEAQPRLTLLAQPTPVLV